MPDEANEKLEDIVSIPVTATIHGAAVEFGLYDQLWGDGSYIFHGYKSKNNPKLTLSGQQVSLQVKIFPQGTPQRSNPFLASVKPNHTTVVWYENALPILSAAFTFLREFEEKRRFLLDGSLDSETEKYYNYADLSSQLNAFTAVMRNNTLEFSKKVYELAPILTSIRRILEINRIPDHLKYEESTFYLNVLKLQEHVQWLIEETDKTEEDIIPDFKLIAQHLTDVLNDIHNDHQNVARGRESSASTEEKEQILKALDELAHIKILEKGSHEAMQQIGRELELCQEIWSNPKVDWQTRLDCATQAVDLISDAISQMEASAIANKKRYAQIPDLSRFINEANEQLAELSEAGLPPLFAPLADQFLASINEARQKAGEEGVLSREELINAIRLNSMLLSISEKNGQLESSLGLYLTDTEYIRSVHYMHILLRNGQIQEMKLLGR